MSDIVYLYPKTSCPCADCGSPCEKPVGLRSNISVRGCTIPKCLDCSSRIGLGTEIEPTNKKGWTQINPQVYTEKFAEGFGKVPCKQASCPDVTYISPDPRLYSVTENAYLRLDRPPISGRVHLNDIYSKKWDSYGLGFKNYEDIQDGQIEYYIDKSIQDPYFNPLFAEKAQEVAVLYQDPMYSLKPEYTRIPLKTENPTVTTPECYPYCLSFIQDTQSHREDLLSYQMRRRNQERWETRWKYE